MARQMALSDEDWTGQLVAAGFMTQEGEVINQPGYELTNYLKETVDELRFTLENVNRECNAKANKIRRLQREEDLSLRHDPDFDTAMGVLEHWRKVCHPGARELAGGDRLRKVLARLHGGYTAEQLCRCAEGYAKRAYVVNGHRAAHGSKTDWRAEAELVYRDPDHVDYGLRAASLEEDMQMVMSTSVQATIPAMPDLGGMGQAAVRYATYGWLVFPCVAGDKFPATHNGLLDACRDVERISRYWRAAPESNVAIRTGAQSGIVVLDVDDVKGGLESLHQLEQRYSKLPETASIVTPRGGSHLYFRHPGFEVKNTQGVPGPGLDIRGDGGYVLAPPSLVGQRPYQLDTEAEIAEMPAWLSQGLRTYQKRVGGKVDPAVWEKMLQGIAEGGRNDSLTRLAGYLWSHNHPPGVVLGMIQTINRERCSPPLPDRDVHRIVESVQHMRA